MGPNFLICIDFLRALEYKAFGSRRYFVVLAEREGFEPSVPCGTLVFKTSAIDHSATSPGFSWSGRQIFQHQDINRIEGKFKRVCYYGYKPTKSSTMKKILTFLFLWIPFISIGQIIGFSTGDPRPPISAPASHESIGYFMISSDSTVRVENCFMSFTEGFESINHLYLNVDELPYISWGDEFLVNPMNQSLNFVLNLEGEENTSMEYYADLIDVGNPVSIAYDLVCMVSPLENTNLDVWTDTLHVSTPVYTYVANAGKSSRLSLRGKSILVPKHMNVSVHDMTGREVLFIPASHTEKKYYLDLQTGIYFLIANNKFSGRIFIRG